MANFVPHRILMFWLVLAFAFVIVGGVTPSAVRAWRHVHAPPAASPTGSP